MKQILITAAAHRWSTYWTPTWSPLPHDVWLPAGPCAHYLKDVTCHFCRGVLTLEGRVPTSRLKETVRYLLRDMDGVNKFVDRVDVVSSHGLSSIHDHATSGSEQRTGNDGLGRIRHAK